jgi:hypothetical protein
MTTTTVSTPNTSRLAHIISYDDFNAYWQSLHDERSGYDPEKPNMIIACWSSAICDCGKDSRAHSLGLRKPCYYCDDPSEEHIDEYFKYVNKISPLRTPSEVKCHTCRLGTIKKYGVSGGQGMLHHNAPCYKCLMSEWWCSDCEQWYPDHSDCGCVRNGY